MSLWMDASDADPLLASPPRHSWPVRVGGADEVVDWDSEEAQVCNQLVSKGGGRALYGVILEGRVLAPSLYVYIYRSIDR